MQALASAVVAACQDRQTYGPKYQAYLKRFAPAKGDDADDLAEKNRLSAAADFLNPSRCAQLNATSIGSALKNPDLILSDIDTAFGNQSSRDSAAEENNASELASRRRKEANLFQVTRESLTCGDAADPQIDLSNQFPPTKDQGPYNTCYAQSAVGLIEASLFRSSGQTYALAPSEAAICYARSSQKDKKKKALNGEPVVDLGDAGLALQNVLDHGWLKNYQATSDLGDIATHERLQQFVFKTAALTDPLADRVGNAAIKRAISSSADALSTNVSTSRLNLDEREPGVNLTRAGITTSAAKLPLNCEPGSPLFRQRLKGLMKLLCAKIPTGVKYPIGWGEQYSDDGGKSWKLRAPIPLSSHVVIATGFRWDLDSGTPWLYLRNSWSEGTAATPNRSQIRFDALNVCLIDETQAAFTATDRERLNHQDVPAVFAASPTAPPVLPAGQPAGNH